MTDVRPYPDTNVDMDTGKWADNFMCDIWSDNFNSYYLDNLGNKRI